MKKFLIAVLFLAASQVATAQQGEGKIAKLNYRELVKGLISPNKPIRIILRMPWYACAAPKAAAERRMPAGALLVRAMNCRCR